MRRSVLGRVALGAVGLVVVSSFGLTAANSVPVSRAGRSTTSITANALKPSACSGITVTTVVKASGTFTGGGASELIVGSAAADTINGGAGDDCILGGGGDDGLSGGLGTDVCIGGPGNDQNGVVVVVPTDLCETFIQ